MDIEVTIKFDTAAEKYISQDKLQLAVSILAALGAKFPSADAEVEKALQTLTDIGSKGKPFVMPSQDLPTG